MHMQWFTAKLFTKSGAGLSLAPKKLCDSPELRISRVQNSLCQAYGVYLQPGRNGLQLEAHFCLQYVKALRL